MWTDRFANADVAYKAGYHWNGAKPCDPTPFAPGTYEKLFVLRVRYWAGQELWNRDDATPGTDGDGSFRGTHLPR